MTRIPTYVPATTDLRRDFNHAAMVAGGVLYRKGNVVQVWWLVDAEGRPSLMPIPETWTCPSVEEARRNFEDMRERWM